MKSDVVMPNQSAVVTPNPPKSYFASLSNYVLSTFKRLPKSTGPVNVNQSFIATLNEPITILGFQTGLARNNKDMPKTNKSTLSNLTIEKSTISHMEEATNEMEDFKEKFGDFFYDEPTFNMFHVFLSIGTTSIQGWIKTGQSKGYKVIIPDGTNTAFQQIGTTVSSTPEAHTKLQTLLKQILKQHENKKILCFNTIGNSDNVPNGNLPVPIQEHQRISSISRQKNNVVLDLLACNTSNNIFIFPREGIINGKQFEANWASKLATKHKKWVVAIGGDEVFLYDPQGNRDEKPLYTSGTGPNHFYATNGFTKEADTKLMEDILERLLQKKKNANKNASIIGGRKKTKKYKRYKRKSRRS